MRNRSGKLVNLLFILALIACLQAVVLAAPHRSHKPHRDSKYKPKPVRPKLPEQKPGRSGFAVARGNHRWENSKNAGKVAVALNPPPVVPELISPYSDGNVTVSNTTNSTSSDATTSSNIVSTTTTVVNYTPGPRSKGGRSTGVKASKPSTSPKSRHRKRQLQSFQLGNKVLIIAPSDGSEQSAVLSLKSYGIPHDVLIIAQSGYSGQLPLESGANDGKYNLIVISGDVVYEYNGNWLTALTGDQQNQLRQYQIKYNVRLIKFNIWPTSEHGVSVVGSCCGAGVEHWLSFDSTAVQTLFPSANLKSSAQITTQGLWHYGVTIINSTLAKPVAHYSPNSVITSQSVAAVYNKYDDNTEAMIFFIGFGSWSGTSSILNHAWIHWGTRGVYAGFRRVLLSTQIDDLMLPTDPWPASPNPEGARDRIVPEDMDALVTWQADINDRLPAGSDFKLEWAINGNGIPLSCANCSEPNAMELDVNPATDLTFKKPLGTGVTLWPSPPPQFNWGLSDCQRDPLCNWFISGNLDHFYLLSHTFTHEYLNNVTYHDCQQEILFNRYMFAALGIDQVQQYSTGALVPPSISGVLNGDCIKAWLDSGINNVVGDNSRPYLMDPTNEYWPAISTDSLNGWDGLTIIPRWPTNIYYDVGSPSEAVAEYNHYYQSYFGQSTLSDILQREATRVSSVLINLRHDPYMFHQLNLRNSDLPQVSLPNGENGRFGLLQRWVEYVTTALVQVADWPIISQKQDVLAQTFLNRKQRDLCGYSVTNVISGGAITGFEVSATTGSCTVPVTVPAGTSISDSGLVTEQIGSDPKTVWVPVTAGNVVSFTINPPLQL